jgi:hypothetical protein
MTVCVHPVPDYDLIASLLMQYAPVSYCLLKIATVLNIETWFPLLIPAVWVTNKVAVMSEDPHFLVWTMLASVYMYCEIHTQNKPCLEQCWIREVSSFLSVWICCLQCTLITKIHTQNILYTHGWSSKIELEGYPHFLVECVMYTGFIVAVYVYMGIEHAQHMAWECR